MIFRWVFILLCGLAYGLRQDDIIQLRRAGLEVEFTEDKTITITSDALPSTLREKRHRGAKSRNLRFKVNRYPTRLEDSVCLSEGMIGISIDGVPIYNPYTKDCCNAGYQNRKWMDGCWGKVDSSNHYYYDVPPLCAFKNMCNASTLIGVALDGFPIYGPYDGAGKYMEDLDECNGKDDQWGGYRYHVTENFPYMMGCFRSSPLAPSRCTCAALNPDCKSSQNFRGHINGTLCCKPDAPCDYIINQYSSSAKKPTSLVIVSIISIAFLRCV